MMEPASLKVKIEIFEGPLDLLLYLVRKNSYDIFDIPIAEITNQYLEYLEMMKSLNLNIVGDFLVMAATLLRIKVQMLLPKREDEDAEEVEDLRADLARQLYQLYIYKEAARRMDNLLVLGRDTFAPQPRETPDVQDGLIEAELFDLISAFAELIRRRRPAFDYRAARFRFTVIDRMDAILDLLERKGGKLELSETIEGHDLSRELVIATFLALLELVRIGRVRVYQPKGQRAIYLFERAASVWLAS